MNAALQDDDLWRRAFTANAGLFFDNHVSEFGPLLTGDGPLMAGSADPAAMPPTSPVATIQNANVSAAGVAPMPAMDFTSALPMARQQQQQQHQQHQHQPNLRVKIASRPTLVAPPLAAATAAGSEDLPFLQARPTLAPQQQQQRILGPSPMLARETNAQAPSKAPAAEGTAPVHEAAAADDDPLQQASVIFRASHDSVVRGRPGQFFSGPRCPTSTRGTLKKTRVKLFCS